MERGTMKQKNMYQAYAKTNVQTSDQLSLILMLYDGMIRFMKKSIVKINQQDVEGAHTYIKRSKDILTELLSTLKVEAGGEVGQNLKNLYLYAYECLTEANLTKNPKKVEEALKVMMTLRQGWSELKEQQAKQKAMAFASNVNANKRIRVNG